MDGALQTPLYLRYFKDDFDVLWQTHYPFSAASEYVIKRTKVLETAKMAP